MSIAMPDAGTIEVTDEMLERFFEDPTVCEADDCDDEAKWQVTALPCKHSFKACTYHKIMELQGFEFDRDQAHCHLDPSVRVTDLKAVPLP